MKEKHIAQISSTGCADQRHFWGHFQVNNLKFVVTPCDQHTLEAGELAGKYSRSSREL